MARGFVKASSQSLTPVGLSDLTSQMSFGCLFSPGSTVGEASFNTLLSKGASGTDRNYGFDYRGISGVEKLEVYWTQPASTYVEHSATVVLSNSVFISIVWTIDWTTNPDTVTLYVDGVSQSLELLGSNNSSPTTAATQAARIGAFSTGADFLDGSLAELFVTSDIVSASEAASLAKRFSPDLVLRRHAFDCYFPLIGNNSPETDPLTGKTATLNNAPAKAAHPRIIKARHH